MIGYLKGRQKVTDACAGFGSYRAKTNLCSWCESDRPQLARLCKEKAGTPPEIKAKVIRWFGPGKYRIMKESEDRYVYVKVDDAYVGDSETFDNPPEGVYPVMSETPVTEPTPSQAPVEQAPVDKKPRVTQSGEYIRIIRAAGEPLTEDQIVEVMRPTFPNVTEKNLKALVHANNVFLVQCGAMVEDEQKRVQVIDVLKVQ